MKHSKFVMVVGCCLGLIGAAACSSGLNGIDGATGATGPQGPQGPQGDPGTNGTNGTNGEAGATGPQGQPGAAGEQGPQGQTGDIACGDSLIAAADWHSACNATVPADPSGVAGVCFAGVEECRLTDQDGELVPQVMCWDTVHNTAAVLPSADPKFPNN